MLVRFSLILFLFFLSCTLRVNATTESVDINYNKLTNETWDKPLAYSEPRRGKHFTMPMGEHGYFTPENLQRAPADKYGDEVRLGFKIFTETQRYAPRYAGRGLTCNNCHLEAGRKPNSGPMWAAMSAYPVYFERSDRTDTIEDRIRTCFAFSMNGFPPAPDAPETRALVAYFHFLSKGAPMATTLPGRSFPDLGYTGQEPSKDRGKVIYKTRCMSCHGENGEGQKQGGEHYIYPPLWGWDSYNKASSFYHVRNMLARFIWANMPLKQDFELTQQEAMDVAAYINIHDRPKDPRKGVWSDLMGR